MICASYKENGEVVSCYPHSVLFQWRHEQIGEKLKGKWCYGPGKHKVVEYTIRECQCYQCPVFKPQVRKS